MHAILRRSSWILPVVLLASVSCERGGRASMDSRPVPPVPRERLTSIEAIERGARRFATSCALCHGSSGDGQGARHAFLDPPATDFTDPVWRSQATPESVYLAIRDGKPGTAMASWRVFTDDDLWNLVAFVLQAGNLGGGA